MQWFDEPDYYQDRFVRNSSGLAHLFETEKEAIDKLNEWYTPEQIDPEYRLTTRIDLVRD